MWWLLLLLLIPAVSWLLPAAVGAVTSPSASGRFYLRTLLKQAGVLQLVPDGCVRELVEHDVALARTISKLSQESMKTEMVKTLDGTATLAIVWITGEQLPIKEDGFVPRTLMKYGIERGAIKHHA
jgi:hypothetical protein